MKINGGLVTCKSITSDKIPNSAGVIFHFLDNNLASLPQIRIRQAEQNKWGPSCTEGRRSYIMPCTSVLLTTQPSRKELNID